MAAAEARAAWQRTANRCFIQEDAKRAPKLACCPSSPSSSKPQVDGGPTDAGNGPDNPNAGFMPLNWNPSNSNLPPDTRWWLQLQPNFGYQKDFTNEQLNALEAELEILRTRELNRTSKVTGDHTPSEAHSSSCDTNKYTGPPSDPHWIQRKHDSEVRMQELKAVYKHDPEVRTQEVKAVNSCNMQWPLKHKDVGDYWYQEEPLKGLDSTDHVISKQPDDFYFDFESPWMGGEKTEPWWRTADKDELASLVAQKSLEHIENCDLPKPRGNHIRRGPFDCFECSDHGGISVSLDLKEHTVLSDSTDHAQSSPSLGIVGGKQWTSGEVGHSLYGSDKPFRSSNSYNTTDKDPTEIQPTFGSDPSKAELLEALRHSQTRAREAEKAAQQAYNEKEHIIKLFFRQASYLFAYKQWFQLLQLETFCLQLKNKDHPISSLFPVVLPWIPYKGRQSKKARHRPAKGNRGPTRSGFGKYAVAFAVGLGLAGAGILLGWTMGWLLPTL